MDMFSILSVMIYETYAVLCEKEDFTKFMKGLVILLHEFIFIFWLI